MLLLLFVEERQQYSATCTTLTIQNFKGVDRTGSDVTVSGGRCPCHVTRDVTMTFHVRMPVTVAQRRREVTGPRR